MPQRRMPALTLLTFHVSVKGFNLAHQVVVSAREGGGMNAKQRGRDIPSAHRGSSHRKNQRRSSKKGLLGKKEADFSW